MSKLKIQSRKVQFPGFSGLPLMATLDFPEQVMPLHYALISHCFTCTRQTLTTARLSRGLAQAGLAVLRFDFTGLGESEGEFADTHFRSMIADIVCAAEFLSEHYQPPKLLLGHSMGGTASLAASQLDVAALSQVTALATLASPAAPDHVLHHFGSAMALLEQGKSAEINVAGRLYPVKPSFISDVKSYDMNQQMSGCTHKILAARASADTLVAPEAAEKILDYTQGEKHLLNIEGADHLFSDRIHADQLEKGILGWLNC